MVEGLDSVIEKLTEKVAISAEALRPIATETLRQIQLRGIVAVLSGCAAVLLAAGVVMGGLCICRKRELDDDEQFIVLLITSAIAALLVFLGGNQTMFGLNQWLAPLPYALGM